MLIGASSSPFEDSSYLYEFKWDGERAIAYLSTNEVELRNKRNKRMLPIFPELKNIYKQVNERCILDGEYIILKDGKPNFSEVQKRSLMTNGTKIEIHSNLYPACFIAFDILYYKDKQLTHLPLTERKELLNKALIESDRLAISRSIYKGGIELFQLTKEQGLEGIVAKKKDSRYQFDKRTKDWIKIKNLLDDDFIVCGWIHKRNPMTSIVLGKYDSANRLVYKGHVTLGISGADFMRISTHRQLEFPPFDAPPGNENAVWIEPDLVCTVMFMEYTSNGGMRQPVFKGLREDKLPTECKL